MVKEDVYMPILMLLAVPVFVLSILAYSFVSIYQPVRLALTGEMTSVNVLKKDVDITYSRNGPLDLCRVVTVEGRDKPFIVMSPEYDSITVGEQYKAFYSPQLGWGYLTNEPIGWFSSIYNDCVHKPYIFFWVFLILMLYIIGKGLTLLFSESLNVFYKYCDVHKHEEDRLIRNISIAGSLVPYAIVIVFVYLFSIYLMYGLIHAEVMSNFLLGLVAFLAALGLSLSPFLILKIRNIIGNVRFMKVMAALVKISLSVVATYRLLLFVHQKDVSTDENIIKIGWELIKFVFGFA